MKSRLLISLIVLAVIVAAISVFLVPGALGSSRSLPTAAALPSPAALSTQAPDAILKTLTEVCVAVAPMSHAVDDNTPDQIQEACQKDATDFYTQSPDVIDLCFTALGTEATAFAWSGCFQSHNVVMPQANRDALLGKK